MVARQLRITEKEQLVLDEPTANGTAELAIVLRRSSNRLRERIPSVIAETRRVHP